VPRVRHHAAARLRFYEDKGLLAPAGASMARCVYTRRDRARLALILRAKAIGSPLSEIKTLSGFVWRPWAKAVRSSCSYVIDAH